MTKITSALTAVALALVIVSASIAVPILWRGFYYLHIDALQLPAVTGRSKETIREAFDQMMDYEWKDAPFGTGALRWSEEGQKHFEDVRVLFHLDVRVLVVSLICLLLLTLLRRNMHLTKTGTRAPAFYAGLGILIFFGIVTVLAATDFDRAFTVFHRLFFPGKDNWIFDYRTDEIILILPQIYFRNCAILAVSLMAVGVFFCLFLGRKKRSVTA